ncbi:hypothetical protein OHA38_44160 (plasmid) [Streptomyces sp. NBC_01732]|uniref:hypothetical protein n=1 Tax=Streptomyces sp. NBC_01732 TaxID=2975926 RepID=UPI002F906A4F|nr:hypothetical protein OHA38_44160 [Streptomyces sp. NBC_01732]
MSEQPGSDEMDIRETFKLSSEFAPHVIVTEETFFGHGWQPLTTSILMSLWFLPADSSFDVPFLVDWYKRLGWKGANGKPLGAPVIRREIGLIRKAGYVTVTRLRGESGKAVGIQYSVSQRRSDQPESGAWIPVLPGAEETRRSDHVQAMATRGESPHVVDGDNRRSDHVQALTTRGQSPHVVNAANPQVAPRVANDVSPPHPPEEVTTSSPSPLTDTSSHVSLPSQKEGEEAGYAEEDLRAAADVLELLPDPWTQGRLNAGKLAPKLLTVMAEQGWPGIHAVDRLVLTKQLTKNPHKITNPYRLLAGDRIPNLPRYAAVTAALQPAQGSSPEAMCPKHPRYPAGRRCIPCRTA